MYKKIILFIILFLAGMIGTNSIKDLINKDVTLVRESLYKNNIEGTYNSSSIIIDYKTDNYGVLERFEIDKLITIEESIANNLYMNESFVENNFSIISFGCSELIIQIPLNISINNDNYKFDEATCEYSAVDGSNRFRGTDLKSYNLNDYLDYFSDDVYITLYDDTTNSFKRLFRHFNLLSQLGVYIEYLDYDTSYKSIINSIENSILVYQDPIKAINATNNIFGEDYLVLEDEFKEQYSEYEEFYTAIFEFEKELRK